MAGQGLSRIDDTVLVREAQRGDPPRSRSWYGTTTKLWPCTSPVPTRSQDIYQEAFLKAYRNIGAGSSARSIPGFTASLPIFVDAINAQTGGGNMNIGNSGSDVILHTGGGIFSWRPQKAG